MSLKSLSTLKKGGLGTIAKIEDNPLTTRLMELGFLEGEIVEVMHVAPISHDPIAVKVRGTLIALRRDEAKLIWVKP